MYNIIGALAIRSRPARARYDVFFSRIEANDKSGFLISSYIYFFRRTRYTVRRDR